MIAMAVYSSSRIATMKARTVLGTLAWRFRCLVSKLPVPSANTGVVNALLIHTKKERFHASFHHCINRSCHVLHRLQYSLHCRNHPPDGRHFRQTSFENSDRRLLSSCDADTNSAQGLSDTHLTVRLTPRWMLPAGILHNS